MEKVVIIGGKSSATLIADNIYDAQNRHNQPMECIGFAYDDVPLGSDINGFPVVSNVRNVYEKFRKFTDVKFVFQEYDIQNMIEKIIYKDSLQIPDGRYFTFIHPSCMVSRSAKVGIGTIILAHTTINPKAQIGRFNSIMSNVTIGHDANIGDYNLIATQSIVGNIVMGDRNFIGINAATNNKISIGDDCMIGMCSNVIKNVPSGTKCFGNPARTVLTTKKLR